MTKQHFIFFLTFMTTSSTLLFAPRRNKKKTFVPTTEQDQQRLNPNAAQSQPRKPQTTDSTQKHLNPNATKFQPRSLQQATAAILVTVVTAQKQAEPTNTAPLVQPTTNNTLRPQNAPEEVPDILNTFDSFLQTFDSFSQTRLFKKHNWNQYQWEEEIRDMSNPNIQKIQEKTHPQTLHIPHVWRIRKEHPSNPYNQ